MEEYPKYGWTAEIRTFPDGRQYGIILEIKAPVMAKDKVPKSAHFMFSNNGVAFYERSNGQEVAVNQGYRGDPTKKFHE